MDENVERRHIGNYVLTHHRYDPERLLVVFSSAGGFGVGEPIDEFRKSLMRFGSSLLFVRDRSPCWFSRPEANEVLVTAAGIAAAYPLVATLGESMGGSGAIAFSHYSSHVSRVLAFSPQFSMAEPFISFDDRYSGFWQRHTAFNIWEFTASQPELVTILFGNAEWQDAVHAGMYWACGYRVNFVDGSGHLVAAHLKRHGLLLDLLGAFADFSAPFDQHKVTAMLGVHLTPAGLRPQGRFSSGRPGLTAFQTNAYRRRPRHLPPPNGLHDLALHRPTDQSSVSPWSTAQTTLEDSAGAVAGVITGSYGFHTAGQAQPWWRVDLGAPAEIAELRIYNRLEHAERGVRFAIEGSDDGAAWLEIWRKSDLTVFGGADGNPFIWRPEQRPVTRHVRIRLLDENCLHYDAVEIYGQHLVT